MSDMNLIEKVLKGATLRTVMRPDPDIPSNRPEHIEGFDLADVVIQGDFLWASGPRQALASVMETAPHAMCGSVFYYSNRLDVFASHSSPEKAISLYHKSRYKDHKFLVRNDYRVIWDSGEPSTSDVIRDAIEAGARLRIAMLDEENVWNVHIVELPVFSLEDGLFQLNTQTGLYPACFRNPQFNAEIEKRMDDFFVGDKTNKAVVRTGLWPSYLMVFSDGSYRTTYGFSNATRHASSLKHYKHLKVLSDIF